MDKFKLGEIATFYNGRAYKNHEFKTKGTPIVRIQNLNNAGTTVYSDLKLEETKYIEYDDLIYAWSATFGPYIWKGKKSIYHYHIWKIQCNENYIKKYFLYYKLHQISNSLKNIGGNGSIFSHITKSFMENYEIYIPKLEVQEKIIHILKTIDDKIELNTQTNQTLEAMAQAIFKHWFIDFAPVHAKANALAAGKTTEQAELATMASISGKTEAEIIKLSNSNPQAYQQLQQTAAAFPSEFVESEMGLVPKGWEVKPVGELFEIGIGKTPPRKENQWFSKKNTDVQWISIKDMGNNGMFVINSSEYLTKDAVDRFNIKRIPQNTVLLSFKLTIGRASITTTETTTNEAIAHFKTGKSYITSEFLYCYLKNFDFEQLGNTSSIATAVNSKTIRNIKIIFPTEAIINLFSNQTISIFEKIKNNTLQNQTLAQTRDTLLPKLLNGEIEL
ncbi:type I restriction enzyme S subunit [Volucribacter psittacicida]|uniref:Type I restriction enzyme S subunit n=1 Tax=Volucribacter psittacicida TaxID=203482 RepID=A0A4R1FJ41_9PAST|nr:restriction endonuclease subunit S [Volucribacter psittacicida]TCJ94030.1 type I restriction enzyme S subunit [Volucribacter psittacicida]